MHVLYVNIRQLCCKETRRWEGIPHTHHNINFILNPSSLFTATKSMTSIGIIQYGSIVYQYEIIGLLKISHSMKQPCSCVCLKRNASKMFKQWSSFVKQIRKSNILIYSKLLKFHTLPKFHLPDCLPACHKTRFR